jgi:Holliday junction resolvase RusA-like endonuclease
VTSLMIDVLGTPAPQGSKKGFYNQKLGRVVIVEDSKEKTRTWRQDVLTAAVDAQPDGWQPIDGPVWIEAYFYFKRPAAHFGSGRNAGILKASAPEFPAVKPDVDKVLRATLDALAAAGCFCNDSRVVSVRAEKRYVDEHHRLEGAVIEVNTLDAGQGPGQHPGGAAVTASTIPCKRPKVIAEPVRGSDLVEHTCHVPGCGWTFRTVKSAQEPGWHRRDHRDAVPTVDLSRGERGFTATCACGFQPYDGVETSRQSVEQSMNYHLARDHGLVTC